MNWAITSLSPASAQAVLENKASFSAYAVKPDGTVTEFPVSTGALTEPERQIIADGCLINYYRNNQYRWSGTGLHIRPQNSILKKRPTKRTEHAMDEKDLQIFLTLAETGNLTRTAEKLYLAQPTLSKRLQNLESELGATAVPAQQARRHPDTRRGGGTGDRSCTPPRILRTCGSGCREAARTSSAVRCASRYFHRLLHLPPAGSAGGSTPPTTRRSSYRVSSGHSRECVRTDAGPAAPTLPSCGANTTGTRARLLLERESGLPHPQPGQCQTCPCAELRYIGRDAEPRAP